MTEATLVKRILKALNTLPHCKAIKLHGNPYVEKGTPDIHATVRGRSVWLEVKLPGGKPTRLQAHRLLEWRQTGAVWAIVHSIEEALQIVMSDKHVPQLPELFQVSKDLGMGAENERLGHIAQLVIDAVASFGWHYAESTEPGAGWFCYWKGEGDPPVGLTSCECIEDVWQRLWNAGRMDAEWAKQMREAWEIPGYPGVITLLESAARLCRDNGFRSHANEIDAFLERCRPLLKPETEIGGD